MSGIPLPWRDRVSEKEQMRARSVTQKHASGLKHGRFYKHNSMSWRNAASQVFV